MKTPGIGRNDPCPCGSGKKFKHRGYTWRSLVHFAGFLGLATVEPVSDEHLCHEYRVKSLPLLDQVVQFQLPK